MAAMSALFAAIAAIGSQVVANEGKTPPAGQTTALPAAGAKSPAASSVFGSGLPQTTTPSPPNVSLGQFIDPAAMKAAGTAGPSTAFDESAGPAHPMPSAAAPKKSATPGVGDVLSQVPEALASVAPFLGMGQQQRRQSVVLPAQGGGQGGSMVQGFNLPRRTTIGELLAALPRPHYG